MNLTEEYFKLGFYTVCDVKHLKKRHQRHIGQLFMKSNRTLDNVEYFFKTKGFTQNCIDIFLLIYCFERRQINQVFYL